MIDQTEIKARLERTRAHLIKHRTTYLVGATALTVGVLGGAALVRTNTPTAVNVKPKVNQIMSWKPKATIEVYVEALGDPGNIIQDVTTGTIYASQGQAAKALGLTPARVSEQLNGLRDTVNGHQFVKLGKAVVADA